MSHAAPAPTLFTTTRRVEFADTDLSGLVHFSRFFVFMESAEHQFLESLGTKIHTTVDGEELGWPRVSVRCDYLAPAHFGDLLTIEVRVAHKGRSSMTYDFRFRRGETAVARGRTTAVCCAVGDPAKLRKVPVPAVIADQVEEMADDN